METGIVLQK